LSEQYYQSGISKLSSFGTYGNECIAYGYFGLSRISEIKKDMNASKNFRDKALKLATFKKINFDK